MTKVVKQTRACGSCKWFFASPGECRRFPPTPLAVNYMTDEGGNNLVFEYMRSWVDAQNWCGEFKQRNDK